MAKNIGKLVPAHLINRALTADFLQAATYFPRVEYPRVK